MKKQVDYRVIIGQDSSNESVQGCFHFVKQRNLGKGDFYSKIKEYMNDGWVCQGDITMHIDSWYQTMIKYED
tara:strand:- start:2249 stop:2464 length:216 start_codon:yes stop_codon:yes gene_type:complete